MTNTQNSPDPTPRPAQRCRAAGCPFPVAKQTYADPPAADPWASENFVLWCNTHAPDGAWPAIPSEAPLSRASTPTRDFLLEDLAEAQADREAANDRVLAIKTALDHLDRLEALITGAVHWTAIADAINDHTARR